MSGGYLQLRAVLDQGSGAVSGPVRVSYFDPRTGEPCATKPEPLHGDQEKRGREREGYRASLARGWKKRAVMVGGVEYESIAAAAPAVGVSKTKLAKSLRDGAAEVNGRSVRYAADVQPPPMRTNNPGHKCAVLVDGVRHESIADAAAALGYSRTYFASELRSGRRDYGGRTVEYADKAMKPEPAKTERKPMDPAKYHTRPVMVDGVRYARLMDAAAAVGCSQSYLSMRLKEGYDRVKGCAVAYA